MTRMRMFIAVALVIAAGLMFVALHPVQAATGPVTVMLAAENNSGETGTATLTDLGNGKTQVEVNVTGEPDGASQPMHIHEGQCGPTLGKVVFPLTNLENGKSTTTIDTALDALMTGGFALNGHKSAQEISVYVFCGNIPESDAMMMAHETATSDAMMMHETPTGDAMMAQETATSDAMMMAHETATESAMMAQATPTGDAMMAQETATSDAMMMAEATATPASSAPTTLPTTGGSPNFDGILALVVVAFLAIGVGFGLRQITRKS